MLSDALDRFPCWINGADDEGLVVCKYFVQRREVRLSIFRNGESRAVRIVRLSNELLHVDLEELGSLLTWIATEEPPLVLRYRNPLRAAPYDNMAIACMASVLSGENEFEIGQPYRNRWHGKVRLLHRTPTTNWVSCDFEFPVLERFAVCLLDILQRYRVDHPATD